MKSVYKLALCLAVSIMGRCAVAQNSYVTTTLVANDASYSPLVMVDPLLINGWGITLRPPGAGGHFWISNSGSGTTTTYVGDVHRPDGSFQSLFQDSLTVVNIPQGEGVVENGIHYIWDSQPTGQVYNYSPTDFVVSGEGITAASKFIFVNADGTISGWTERRDEQNVLHRQTQSVITVDNSSQSNGEILYYTGCAVTDFPQNNRLYVTNTQFERIEMYDHNWNRMPLPPLAFRYPIDQPISGVAYIPWNIQYFRTGPNNEGRLWVTYIIAEDPWEEDPLYGAVGEFDLEGNFIRGLTSIGDSSPIPSNELKAPWGLAVAPSNFGPFSNSMLVANFSDGTIAAFNLQTNQFIDYLRDATGEVLAIDGIWGMVFGNGVALGDSDALYWAAGPNNEQDGAFGTIRFTPSVCPSIRAEQQPASVNVVSGTTAHFTIDVPSPVRCSYAWQVLNAEQQWVQLFDGDVPGVGLVTGSTAASLTIANPRQDVSFRVAISNDCGSVVSASAQLDVSGCDSIDFNSDGSLFDPQDIDAFLSIFGEGPCVPATATCGDIDFNNDASVFDPCDIDSFLTVFGEGPCTSC
ncbi:MAG: TIGR03118 family protein [Phycisphaerales bacterium]